MGAVLREIEGRQFGLRARARTWRRRQTLVGGLDKRTGRWYSSTTIPLSIVRDMANLLKISEAASLALHTMVYLAANNGRLVTTHEIGDALRVSEAHLAKVLQRLVKVGLVDSTRGPRGGFCLAKSGADISLLEVYETIEGPLTPTNCLLGTPICSGEKCILGGLLEDVNKRVKEYFAQTRLHELTDVYQGEKVTQTR